MSYPFDRLHTRFLVAIIWPLLAITVGLMLVLLFLGAPLETAAAPNGIVSFELAGTLDRATEILDSWDEAAKLRAAFVQGLDYLFLLIYSTMIAVACIWAARILGRHNPMLARLGRLLAWGQWLAALLDAIENAALVALLFGWLDPLLPPIARGAALIKFSLILAGILYSIAGAWVRLIGRRRPTARATL